jgi:dihydropteroate synthase
MLTLGTLQFDVPAVMGVLNVTPDSFSDGGRFVGRDAALRQAEAMARDGAAIIDVGGESTRPGAADVPEQAELDRVLPVIEAVVSAVGVPVSIDTSKPAVMRAAVAAGAAMINDIRALREDGALQAAVELQCPVCLMHMQGEPRTMQDEPEYRDIVAEVGEFLADRVRACVAAGLAEELSSCWRICDNCGRSGGRFWPACRGSPRSGSSRAGTWKNACRRVLRRQ